MDWNCWLDCHMWMLTDWATGHHHSMKGANAGRGNEWADQGGSVDVAAMVIAGTQIPRIRIRTAWINAYGNGMSA